MSSHVKFGVRMHQHGYTFDELKRVWTRADRLQYHSATLYDLLNAPALECWTALSGLATLTNQIRLTPLVLGNTYRPPALLAKMSSTLDVISGGRLELGIGAGGGTGDHLASGLPFPSTAERVRMLEEAVELIKKSWTEPSATYQGQYYNLEQSTNEPKPLQHPHPPVLIGGHGERHLLRSVAGHADLCNIGFEMSLEEHQSKMEIVRSHCDDLGRDASEIGITHNTRVIIAESEKEFEDLAVQGAASANISLAEYKKSLSGAISGTPEQCVHQLSKYVDEGIHYFFLLFPDPITDENLDLFASEVMHHFT